MYHLAILINLSSRGILFKYSGPDSQNSKSSVPADLSLAGSSLISIHFKSFNQRGFESKSYNDLTEMQEMIVVLLTIMQNDRP